MTHSIVPQSSPSDNILGEPTDALRELFADSLDAVMRADVDARLEAGHYERSDARTGYRNGTRPRLFDTRMGTIELNVPRIRGESYQPTFLTRYQRVEQALIALIHEAYINGLSTRKIQKLVDTLGIASLSKSQVSVLNAELDALVSAFRTRQLTEIYPYFMCDAIYEKIRIGRRTESRAVVVAYGITLDGRRELIGVEIVDTESYDSWAEFFRMLKARGLQGVRLVISDAHAGLKKAIAEIFLGASWQRCKVHFLRNVLAAVSKRDKEAVANDLKPLFTQKQRGNVMLIVDRIIAKWSTRYERAMSILLDGIDDALSYLEFPAEHASKISSTNPVERLNREIRRRTRVVGVFPSVESALRLIGMILLEQTEDWESQRGYMSAESMREIELMEKAA